MKLLIFNTIAISSTGGECSLGIFSDLMTYNISKRISG